MQIKVRDYKGSDAAIRTTHAAEWSELELVLKALPLHLKASDQNKRQGNPIFDPVGTNAAIGSELRKHGWEGPIPIPAKFDFLGTGIDFGKNGVVAEVQFSNYPFLLNNTIRSELFFRDLTVFHGQATDLIVIVTKGNMFPASNSTLYFEQAVKQLDALAVLNVFTVPIRLVGLFENTSGVIQGTWTKYSAARTSRTLVGVRETRNFMFASSRKPKKGQLAPTPKDGERCKVTAHDVAGAVQTTVVIQQPADRLENDAMK